MLNVTNKIFLVIFCFLALQINAQQNNKIYFQSSPSFHNGFSIELDTENEIVKFSTNNIYYTVDSLKSNYKSFPNFSFEDEVLKSNGQLLSNSTFEKVLNQTDKNILISLIRKLINNSRNVDPSKFGYDGIIFEAFDEKNNYCKIWSPSDESEQGKIVLLIFEELKKAFNPNSFVDKYIFESKFYIDENRFFEVKSYKPLLIKFYGLSFFYCEKLQTEIENLPQREMIIIDFTEIINVDEETKECIVEGFNKKYKNIKIIQSQEKGFFNKF